MPHHTPTTEPFFGKDWRADLAPYDPRSDMPEWLSEPADVLEDVWDCLVRGDIPATTAIRRLMHEAGMDEESAVGYVAKALEAR